ncbi:dipeptidase [Pseudaeromonas paramecii]|uniref:Dipeptidase n=1 Tax=Pseudaeromonas paramecii TaxID=2138166 RepID=A0ABP8Q2G4_9GAMM
MCTTMAVGKHATLDGSVIIAHSDDDVSDERLIQVPATSGHAPARDTRPVYYDNAALGPMTDPVSGRLYNASELYRYIGGSRGPGYQLTEEEKAARDLYDSIPLGSIPQVASTYAYFDSSYGVMNEKRLMIGECTCGAKVHPTPEPGMRLFYSAELSRVALERCSNARQAIQLMGQLIADYGYYGTGETLLIGDTDEAWVMEMCGYDMDGTDGLWVAQRVPDNGYFVAANQFRIREVLTDSDDFMYSENLHEVCEALGWWDPAISPLLDWLPTVSFGEYSHPYYSLRRVWRALTKAKPSANLPAWVENGYTRAYPFTLVPDRKLAVADVAAIYRDHYEGTEFDLTRGAGAGPWSNPTRYENNPDQGNAFEINVYAPKGAWERPLSIYRCGMMWINQARAGLPEALSGIAWVGLDRPAANCLLPFYCGVTKLPDCVQRMNLLDFDMESAWWAFNFVANFATLKYGYMMPDLQAVQAKLEAVAYGKIAEFNQDEGNPTPEQLTGFCCEHADAVRKAWWSLANQLIVKYNDGCLTNPTVTMQKIDYPEPWLRQAGYYQGPISYDRQVCREDRAE